MKDEEQYEGKDNRIDIGSMVSQRDLKPYIEIRWGLMHAQLPLKDARDHALHILEACNAAETDAFIVHFLSRILKFPLEKCAVVLDEFRKFREANDAG